MSYMPYNDNNRVCFDTNTAGGLGYLEIVPMGGEGAYTIDLKVNNNIIVTTSLEVREQKRDRIVSQDGSLLLDYADERESIVLGTMSSISIIKGFNIVEAEGCSIKITAPIVAPSSGGSYELLPATIDTLGGIKVGQRLTIAEDGTLSAVAQTYTLPKASNSVLGGIKVGQRLSVSADGVLSADAQTYTLPKATDSVLGGIKAGEGLATNSDGILRVKVGSTLKVDTTTNELNVKNVYALPKATTTVLGGVKVGSGLAVNSDGVIRIADATHPYDTDPGGVDLTPTSSLVTGSVVYVIKESILTIVCNLTVATEIPSATDVEIGNFTPIFPISYYHESSLTIPALVWSPDGNEQAGRFHIDKAGANLTLKFHNGGTTPIAVGTNISMYTGHYIIKA